MKTLILFLTVFLAACGSLETEGTDSSEESNETTADTLAQLLDEGVTVDMTTTITGTWSITSYNLGETSEKLPSVSLNEVDISELSTAEDTITFDGESGSLSSLSMPPLYQYSSSTYSASTIGTSNGSPIVCNVIRTNAEEGETLVTSAPDHTSITGEPILDAKMSYEVIDTGVDPILRFTITGTKYKYCCEYTETGGNAASLILDNFSFSVIATGSGVVSSCTGFDVSAETASQSTSYVVKAAERNIFVIETDDVYIVLRKTK